MRPAELLAVLAVIIGACRARTSETGSSNVMTSAEKSGSPSPDTTLQGESIDSLISRLPSADREAVVDPDTNTVTKDSAVAELKRRLDKGTALTDDQWRAALVRSSAIIARTAWPEGEPYAVSMRRPQWLSVGEIRLVPRDTQLQKASAGELTPSGCGTFMLAQLKSEKYQTLGILPRGRTSIQFEVTVERGSNWDPDEGPPPGIVWNGALTVDVQVVPSLDEAIPAVSNERIDAAVRASLGLAFSTWCIDKQEKRTAILVLDPDTEAFPELAATGLSLQVDLLKDGQVAESKSLIASAFDLLALSNSRNKGPSQAIAFAALKSLPSSLEDDEIASAAWSLRVTGTDRHVLKLWHAKQRWSGQMAIPLSEARANELERAGADGREPWIWSPN